MTKVFATLSILLALAGCAAPSGPDLREGEARAAIERSVALPAPLRGIQVETPGTLVAPSDDIRMCEVVALPGSPTDVYYVSRIEAALAADGQDVVVSAARPGSETESIMDVGTRVPCMRAGEIFGEELIRVFAAQDSYAEERFPTGAGKVLYGGQKLAIETHFVNASSDFAPSKVKLSLHTVDASEVSQRARTASFQNFTIYTPPRGSSSHLGECSVGEAITISQLSQRTQRYATAFRLWRVGGDHDGELIWDHRGARGARKDLLDAPLHLAAGEGLRFQCDYRNTSDRELRYGTSAADETCAIEATFVSEAADGDQDAVCLLVNVDADGIARK